MYSFRLYIHKENFILTLLANLLQISLQRVLPVRQMFKAHLRQLFLAHARVERTHRAGRVLAGRDMVYLDLLARQLENCLRELRPGTDALVRRVVGAVLVGQDHVAQQRR